MITIKEIARQLNMSTTTVSNVIHGKTGEVSPETEQRVRSYLEEVGYIPNINARNLAANHSNIIGVVIKTRENHYMHILSEPFVSEILGGIEEMIRKAGYYMMLYISDDMADILNKVAAWNTDGLLLFWMLDDDALRVYKRFRKPVVCVDTYISEETRAQFENSFVNIGLEDEAGTHEAISYLIKTGHRRIGFLSDNHEGVDLVRFRGYRRALEEAGIKYSNKDFFELCSTKGEIESSMKKLAEKAKKYEAVFCCSDVYASMLINSCERIGISVPEDLSVIGFDDTFPSRLSRPSITTIHQDIVERGRLSIELLLKMIIGEKPESDQIIMKPKLVIRESVKERK
ncbi:MAG: LacI family DNA-binding transcriptional regulator [Lachnospiraceae bacterium]|nr:LacI family DNA-binding transcriptional regulator [Lachnospiraceae bacterium]